jgi:hypothetical protein
LVAWQKHLYISNKDGGRSLRQDNCPQAPSGSAGDLWMQNGAGVIMYLEANRTRLMLCLGGDAVVISMSE